MEAPEKIYLFKNPISEEVDYRWLSNRSCDDNVEYIRKDIVDNMLATAEDHAYFAGSERAIEKLTDTFIEKACEFISEHIESDKYISPDEESYRAGCPYNYFETSIFIDDFKNYMKGN